MDSNCHNIMQIQNNKKKSYKDDPYDLLSFFTSLAFAFFQQLLKTH